MLFLALVLVFVLEDYASLSLANGWDPPDSPADRLREALEEWMMKAHRIDFRDDEATHPYAEFISIARDAAMRWDDAIRTL